MSKSISTTIAVKRAQKGLSRTDLAGKANVTAGYLATVENEMSTLGPDLAERLEKILGTKFSKSEIEKHNDKARAYRRSHAKKNAPKITGKPTFTSKKIKSTTTIAEQGLLPGFAEMIAPQAAELARDLVFKALQKAIGEEMVKVVAKLKVV